ncbi:MAG: protein tyrosine phosphatase [Pseudomonadota bacterium]
MAKRKKKRPPHVAADLSTADGRRRAWRELIWGDHGFLRLRFQNLHQISDEMWRSNQPSPKQIAEHVRLRGIRTIVNLRGVSTKGYYLLEKEACAAEGVELVDFQVFSRDTPTPETIFAARDLFGSITYPALMHCKSGADRAGLMSVLYKLLRQDDDFDTAIKQLSLRYLHVEAGKTGMLDAVFKAYDRFRQEAPKPFLDWVSEDYDRIAIKADFMASFQSRMNLDRILRRE